LAALRGQVDRGEREKKQGKQTRREPEIQRIQHDVLSTSGRLIYLNPDLQEKAARKQRF
jgi:hypothetical protein